MSDFIYLSLIIVFFWLSAKVLREEEAVNPLVALLIYLFVALLNREIFS